MNQQIAVYYVHDPMCSWCWGFRPTWMKIRQAISEKVEVRYLLGGLAPDSDLPMPESMQRDIAGYWRRIQQVIPGTEFNFDFWEKCAPRRSTYPACRAVIAARKQNPALEVEMITAIQEAYYLQAKNPSDDETLVKLATELGLDAEQFSSDLHSDETQRQLIDEMNFSRSIGVHGFPSIVLEVAGNYHSVPLDYNNPQVAVDFILQQAE